MNTSNSPHLTQIPHAVQVAASTDPSVNPEFKKEAVEYLNKVKQACEETWQDCLSLWLQGAGAAGPSSSGRDGKQKLDTDLRMYCEQVVDTMFTLKPSDMSVEAQQAAYTSILEYVNAEWVSGPCEAGQAFFRNKIATTLAYLFLVVYPDNVPNFLQPFYELLTPPDPSSSTSNMHPIYLVIRLLSEIATEIHDPTMRSARSFSKARVLRDGLTRDAIRKNGDEKRAVEGLVKLAQVALDQIDRGDTAQKWIDLAEQSMRTLGTWTPWIDISVSLTPQTLEFYRRMIKSPIMSLRIPAAIIFRTLIARKMKEPAERLAMYRILDIVPLVDALEAETRDRKDDPTAVEFRTAIGGALGQYGTEVIEYLMAESTPQDVRSECDPLISSTIPVVLRFLSDPSHDVFMSVSNFVADLLRRFKSLYYQKPLARGQMPPPPKPISPETRQLMSSILDVSLRQLAWPADADWEAPTGEEPDPDDDLAQMREVRITCRSFIESVALIDKDLHTDVVARIVISTFQALSQGFDAVPWQQAELALNLVYTFGEMNKSNTRAAFYNLPPELSTKAGREQIQRMGANRSMETSSGRSTPSDDSMTDAGSYPGARERIDYSQYPLTPLGELLIRAMDSNVISYPHPAVSLQYFETAIRYVEFWRSKPQSVQPMIEAMIGHRGIHHPDEHVRRRCFYLFTRFIASTRPDLDADIVPKVLDSMKDVLPIESAVPNADYPDEDVLLKATKGRTYVTDQFHLFEAAGSLVYASLKTSPTHQLALLEQIASPLMSSLAEALSRRSEPQAVLKAHNSLMALGNFARGFPAIKEDASESPPYETPFKQMTEALLQALDVMSNERIVRDAARYAFSQFVNAIGASVAELVPGFVTRVVGEYEPSELSDFLQFLSLIMHRLKSNAFETVDMLLLPLLSRIFAALQAPVTGTDDHFIHNRLKTACLNFFTGLMNANLDGVFITDRNKPEFENLLSVLLGYTENPQDDTAQRMAFAFFSRSVIAWGTSGAPSVFAESALSDKSKAVANGVGVASNQHAVGKEARAAQALPGYETFIYQRLLPLCFNFPVRNGLQGHIQVVYEVAILVRNTVQARGQEAIDHLLTDLLPKMNCPPEYATELVNKLKTQQAKDFRHTFMDFLKAVRQK